MNGHTSSRFQEERIKVPLLLCVPPHARDERFQRLRRRGLVESEKQVDSESTLLFLPTVASW